MQVKITCYFKCIIHKKYRVEFNYTINVGVNNKMFEIKKPSSSNKTIRMPDPLIEQLERLAAKHDISFNQLVVQCCEYALENMKPEAPKSK
jgi:predicted HicB family RNase H-like nuclease